MNRQQGERAEGYNSEQTNRGRNSPHQANQINWAKLVKKVQDIQNVRAATIVEVAEEAGQGLKYLKMNQIRRFLTELRKIEMDKKKNATDDQMKDRVILLLPKLAYAAGREKKVEHLLDILKPAIKNIDNWDGFKNLLRLVESIVAYHRAAGGTN